MKYDVKTANMIAAITHPQVTINFARLARFLFKMVDSFALCYNFELIFPRYEFSPTQHTRPYPDPSIMRDPEIMNGSNSEF